MEPCQRNSHLKRNPTTWAEIKKPAKRVVKMEGVKEDGGGGGREGGCIAETSIEIIFNHFRS